ncbi:phosphoribosylanthranilate isomerase [Aquimarina spongiae]|uniref:N-(5'-phosphoribosyl)anthranilate isomerase n=1 Tax=Aquimarina spongiae TaxID=570521 RepID=A0A1M6HMV2_9FLAO|nr:phosphoribosylanthranilate isomerase [Aquimarina spongiae]SHJ23510.1 phosphoribosylanthranilate isomerase [Aquimarina spongiae]
MKLKVCGMKYSDNIEAIASLEPDYLGFIFYDRSPRNFNAEIPVLPDSIKKVGVFVDSTISNIVEKVKQFRFKAIQLHGDESPAYCKELKSSLSELDTTIDLWKVFSIKDEFNFSILEPYEGIVDYFLFDTKGKEKGGNGYTFDWNVLKEYNSKTPFILSGGIGLDEIEKIQEILKTDLPIHAIDVNSKFEIEPGLKEEIVLEKFKNQLTLISRDQKIKL